MRTISRDVQAHFDAYAQWMMIFGWVAVVDYGSARFVPLTWSSSLHATVAQRSGGIALEFSHGPPRERAVVRDLLTNRTTNCCTTVIIKYLHPRTYLFIISFLAAIS